MPLIDIKCANDHIHEVNRPLAMYPQTPPCPTCQSPTEQIHLPKRVAWSCDPVLVFRAPDGTFRFPGDPNGTQVRKYEQDGFERIELRSAADVRRFENQMNQREYARAQRRVERMQEHRENRERMTRSELRRLMQSMTPFGRAVARAAMSRNDQKPRPRASDPGFHVDVFSNYRSNRETSYDPQGRRRRD